MIQEVGVEVGLHRFHHLGALVRHHDHFHAEEEAGLQCLQMLSSQTPKPPGYSSKVLFLVQESKPPKISLEPPKSIHLQN